MALHGQKSGRQDHACLPIYYNLDGKPYEHNYTARPNVTNNLKLVLIIKTTNFRGGKECFVASSAFRKSPSLYSLVVKPHRTPCGSWSLLGKSCARLRSESRTESQLVCVQVYPAP